MENVRFLQGVKQYFCTKALDVILLIYLLLGFILLPYKYLWKDIILSLIHISEPTRHSLISYAVFCLKKFF